MPFRGRIVTAEKNKSSPNDKQQNAQQDHQSQKSTAFHKRGCFVSCRDAGKYVNQALFCALAWLLMRDHRRLIREDNNTCCQSFLCDEFQICFLPLPEEQFAATDKTGVNPEFKFVEQIIL